MLRSKTLILSALLVVGHAYGQTQSTSLDANNTRISILNGGDFFWDLNKSRYEVPKVTDVNQVSKSSIFSGAIWIGGLDESNQLHLAAMTYRQRGQDFWPGPASDDSDSSHQKYDRIYEVSSADITAHKLDPSKTSSDILNWPGNGDTTIGEPWQLAPFIDLNMNGVYEPTLGDYPKIKGDLAAYCIYNDAGLHTESGGLPLNVDVHQMFFQLEAGTNNSIFDETNLAYFKIVNRSENNYHDLRFGVFTDFDLGNFSDDFIACDTVQRMGYVYNGDNNDEGVLGYGINPPAQAVMFMNSPLGAVSYWNNNTNPINGNPTLVTHYYNLLIGNFNNGQSRDHIIGQDTFDGRFMYSGDPVSGKGWTEDNNLNTPSDRRLLTVSESKALNAGESLCFDIAFVYGRTALEGAKASVSVMKSMASQIQQAYNLDYLGWRDFGCTDGGQVASVPEQTELSQFKMYPNPTTGIVHFSEALIGVLYSSTGEEVMNIEQEVSSIDLSQLANGIYVLRTLQGSLRIVKM